MDVRIVLSLISSMLSVVFSARDGVFNSYGASVDVGSKISMVVAIEKDFLDEDTDEALSVIKKYASIINKDYLPVGHLRTRYQTLKEAAFTDGASIIFTIGACRDTWELFEKRQENGDILFISITEVECPRLPTAEAITLPLSKAGLELPQLLLDLRTLNAVRWNSVALIYDQISLADDDIQSVTEALTIELPGRSEPSSALLSIHRLEPAENEWKRLARSEKLLDPTTQWLFVSSDVGDSENVTELAYLLDEGQNVAFVYNNTSEKSACGDTRISCHVEEIMLSIGLALQKSVSAELELSEQVSEEEWDAIKPSKSERRATLLTSIKSRLQNEGRCDNCTNWKLETGEVWGQEYLESRANKLLSVGSWTPRGGPLLSDHLFPHVVQGFRARNLPISTFHFPPWQILHYNDTGHITEYKGLVFEILNLLVKNLNFTYTVHVPTNLTLTGFSNSTKNTGLPTETLDGDKDESALNPAVWNKVISAVQQKKIFLGACAFTVTDARKLAVNFTTAISVEPYVFFLSRPKELSRALLFMSPFSISTWCCITAAVILMTPVLCAISRASPFYRVYGANRAGGFHSPMNCFWYIYGALLQQGGGALPAADSSRLVIGTWWLVVLVVVTTYSGTLVAFLTFPKMDHLSSDEDKLKALYKGARLHPSISKELIEDIRSGHHVYIQRKTSLLFLLHRLFLNTSSCDFSLGTE
ncbi:hypothetical protein LSTR_LSTR002999 [Laodelphax striatellus]|uniref:Ionotropic glutamate receptor C-terminal domain-containing protein n=1 Tax=Laodelphax striatellus TaxID=195883 RepID=A0A482WSC8_LAOST|nr:hypothetical protein LSTR_LSTR002999 [Laodelphax striatellus]